MMKSKTITNSLALLALVLGALLGAGAHAHQQKAAITQVLFNPNTGNIEVSHRFYMHDAEHAIVHLLGSGADILKNPEQRQQFSDYVVSCFSMRHNDQPLALTTLGHEIEGKFFWVYQEAPAPIKVGTLAVQHSALQDIWPKQVNTVNFEGQGKVRTLTFEKSQELLKVRF